MSGQAKLKRVVSGVLVLLVTVAAHAWQGDPDWVAPYMTRLHKLAYEKDGQEQLSREAFQIASQSTLSRADSIKLNLLLRTESTFSAPRSFVVSTFQKKQSVNSNSFFVEALCGLSYSSPTHAEHVFQQYSVSNVLSLIRKYPTDLVLRRNARRFVNSTKLSPEKREELIASINSSYYSAVKGGWEPISNEARYLVSKFLVTSDERDLDRAIVLYGSLMKHPKYPKLLAAEKPDYIKHLNSLRKK